MVKALIKKEFSQVIHMHLKNKNKMKKQSAAGYVLLYLYVAGVFFWLFYMSANSLCAPLLTQGLDWLYFAMIGIIAIFCGVMFTVFSTQAVIYEAKDNELLLSMPVPPNLILFSRILVLYVMNVFFVTLVFLPSLLVYAKEVESVDIFYWIRGIVMILLLSLIVQTLSCILGFLVSCLTAGGRHKNLFTMIFSFAFLAVYFYCYFRINSILNYIMQNGALISQKLKDSVFLIYQMGKGTLGDTGAFLGFTVFAVAVFAICYLVLSVTFLSLVTVKRGTKKRAYKEKKLMGASVENALLRREWKRFLSSPVYMMNGAIGSVLMIAGTVYCCIKAQMVTGVLAEMKLYVPLLMAAIAMAFSCTNIITASSVSMEGKTLWHLQVLPINTRQIMNAKIKLHLWMTAFPAGLAILILGVILQVNPIDLLLVLITSLAYIFLTAVLGLFFNLRHPNFDWTNETYVVKQSLSVFLSLFGNMGILLVSVVIFLFLNMVITFLDSMFFNRLLMAGFGLLFAFCGGCIYRYLVGQSGDKRFRELS